MGKRSSNSGATIPFSLIVCLCLGCASPNKFIVNDKGERVSVEQLLTFRAMWKPGALERVASSHAPAEYHQWILDFIAYQESGGKVGPACSALMLKSITPRDVKYLFDSDGRKIGPLRYLEEWQIESCSHTHVWRVLDEDKLTGGLGVLYATPRKDTAEFK